MVDKEITVKKVEAKTIGKLAGTVNGLVGVVAGVVISIASIIGVVNNNNYGIGADILLSIGILLGGIIVYPLISYGIGWLYGWVLGAVFNVINGVSGGVKIVIGDKK